MIDYCGKLSPLLTPHHFYRAMPVLASITVVVAIIGNKWGWVRQFWNRIVGPHNWEPTSYTSVRTDRCTVLQRSPAHCLGLLPSAGTPVRRTEIRIMDHWIVCRKWKTSKLYEDAILVKIVLLPEHIKGRPKVSVGCRRPVLIIRHNNVTFPLRVMDWESS